MQKLEAPNHIGFIVDGNRRWAKKHSLPPYEGHLAGYEKIKDIVIEAVDQGVNYVSAYVFSTENWKRSEDEVSKLMSLVLKLLTSDLPILNKHNIRLLVLGSRDNLDKKIINAINEAESKTANNTAGTLAICFNYGGRLEIVDAFKKIIKSGANLEDIDENMIEQNLYAPEVPSIDIVVRTSGEQRISNFMLWRSAYSEMMFMEKYWPEMEKKDVKLIIKEYNKRSRRFGG